MAGALESAAAGSRKNDWANASRANKAIGKRIFMTGSSG